MAHNSFPVSSIQEALLTASIVVLKKQGKGQGQDSYRINFILQKLKLGVVICEHVGPNSFYIFTCVIKIIPFEGKFKVNGEN